MEFKKASPTEALQAFQLVVKNYQSRGYLPTAPTPKTLLLLTARFCAFIWKMISFSISDSGYMLVAIENHKVVGTVTLEFDPSTLCVDSLFPKELTELRESGKSFVYFGAFAISKEYSCTRTSMRMFKEQWRLLRERGTEVGICVVNPCHCNLYKRFGFRVLAISAEMPGLSQAPAVLLAFHASEIRL